MRKICISATVCFFVFFSKILAQQAADIVVNASKETAAISSTMWGIFFEDINMSADGGVYAEMLKNRSFEFNLPLMGWDEIKKDSGEGNTLIINRGNENPNNPRFARITIQSDKGAWGLSNEGFRGMGIKKDEQYNFSVSARQREGTAEKMIVELADSNGNTMGSGSLDISGREWKHYTTSFKASATAEKAKLNIWFKAKAVIDIDMVSLFPKHTWKQRPGGLREDLVQLLADLKPGFIRFPGGCIVEGRDLANRYQWKKTIGNIDGRKLIINRWNTEFSYRSTPDYFQTFGLGFYEYFLLAEDIGAEPLPILNCGMACQFNTAEVVPTDDLDPYIQDALDLIEFANGAAETKWGSLRTAMGHAAPFNLKLMGIGNEQWGSQYVERYTIFIKAIKEKYPAIQLVNSTGPFSGGDLFNYLNDTLRKMHADILDEHYYMPPSWFLKNADRYDHYNRGGTKIFAGEYAAHTRLTDSAIKKNNWQSALAEAAFMTGLERNADVVRMASYAPLFAHVDGWQWSPDLIWFDNLHSYGTPNYYLQQLFSNNKGTNEVQILMNSEVMEGKDSLYASACIDKKNNELIVKIVNTSSLNVVKQISIDGVKKIEPKATLIILQSDDLTKCNSLANPTSIIPKGNEIAFTGKQLKLNLLPYSVTVIKVKER